MSLNLIEKAIQYTKEARVELESLSDVIYEPLYPKARHEALYLRMKEAINRGCREATKLVTDRWKRPAVYGILVKALTDIFHYKKTTEIMNVYNKLLDDIIGTH